MNGLPVSCKDRAFDLLKVASSAANISQMFVNVEEEDKDEEEKDPPSPTVALDDFSSWYFSFLVMYSSALPDL